MKSLTFFFIIALSTLSLNAQAFTFNNSAKLVFSQDEVLVNVASNCTNLGVTSDELLSIVRTAVDNFWNQAPTSRLKLRAGSVQSVAAAFRTGEICVNGTNCDPNPTLKVSSDILISCNENTVNFPSTAILGVTIPNNLSGSNIKGALVLINDQAGNQFEEKTRNEKISIIAHELGHAFGLGHSKVEDSLMYYMTMSKRVALGRDDIDGISYLYPKQQPKAGCGTVDFDGQGSGPNWWSGLFLGFSIIGLAELVRKKRLNTKAS